MLNILKRERYCLIEATTLEEILKTCERHIKNISLTQGDYIAEGDGGPHDDFYCNMFRNTWADLHDDVQAMIKKSKPSTFQVVVECFRSGQISPKQFLKHLEDPLFAAWYEKNR